MINADGRRRRLGELLIDAGVLSNEHLQSALLEQKKWGGKLGRTLVEMGFVDEASMVTALSRQLDLPVVDLDRMPLPPAITHLLRVDLAERYGVFPIGADPKQRALLIATSDPTNVEALKELSVTTRTKIQTSVATASSIDRAIRRLYYGEQTVASITATPGTFGVDEPIFDLAREPDASPRPRPSRPSRPSRSAPSPRSGDPFDDIDVGGDRGQVAKLVERIDALERHSAAQARALRALVELLSEAGLITKDDYIARARGRP